MTFRIGTILAHGTENILRGTIFVEMRSSRKKNDNDNLVGADYGVADRRLAMSCSLAASTSRERAFRRTATRTISFERIGAREMETYAFCQR